MNLSIGPVGSQLAPVGSLNSYGSRVFNGHGTDPHHEIQVIMHLSVSRYSVGTSVGTVGIGLER